MSWTIVAYLVLSVLSLSAPGSVIIARGQIQMSGFKVLKMGDYGQCPSAEEKETAKSDLLA